MGRLFRQLPELLIMVKGMALASRAVGSSLLMITGMIYVFGIVMSMLVRDEVDMKEHFSTLFRCCWTLLMDGTICDNTGYVLRKLANRGQVNTTLAVIVFIFFILLSALTVMNMLIGIMCEVVSAVSANEKEEAAIKLMKKSILAELKKYDNDGNFFISADELFELMDDECSSAVLTSLGIDVHYLEELQSFAYRDPGTQIHAEKLLQQMLDCREDLPVTLKHLITQQSYSHYIAFQLIKKHEERMIRHMNELMRQPKQTSAA